MEEKATIRINRKEQYVGLLNKYKVYIDDKPVGRAGNGESVEYIVEAGRHTVFVKLSWDWSRSRKLILDIKPGQVIDLDCGNKNGWIAIAIPAAIPLVRYYYPGGFQSANIYYLFGLMVVLGMVLSSVPSFFVYLNQRRPETGSEINCQ